MVDQPTPLELLQANDETLTGTVQTKDDQTPQDLADVELVMLIKPWPQTPDDHASVITLSTSSGAITVDDPAAGTYTVNIPAAALAAAGVFAYRVDALTAGTRRTVVYGPLTVIDT